jgi:flagellin
MALAISTNTAALNAAASASSVNRDMETSMARLSSGKRINSASDDAAGVAISSRLSAEIRGTDQAIRNSLDGQALIDTAEGAHKEIENILQRMREVSVQAANDTNNDQDRANLQAEMDAMVTEIDRIASTTTWAGENLMQSSTGSSFSFQVGSATGVENQISVSIDGMGSKNLGIAASSGVEVTNAATAQVAYDALVADKVAKDAAAVTAEVTYDNATKLVPALEALKVVNDRLDTDGATPEKQAAAIRDILNAKDAIANVGGTSSNSPEKSAKGMDAMAALMQTFISTHLSDQGEQNNAQAKLDLFTTAIATFKASTTDATALSTFNAVDTAFDAVLEMPTTASVSATNSANGDNKATGAKIRNFADTGTSPTPAHAATVFEDGSNVSELDTLADAVTHAKDSTNQGVAADITAAEGVVTTAKAALVAAEDAAAQSQTTLNAANDPADLKGVNLSVTTNTGARASITTIDTAIQTVNIQRSELGAVSNRLNHTVNNLTNISSNLSAAKGGIEDADFALETTNLAKNQILQQASTAMLAQANASKQNVLSLLQG